MRKYLAATAVLSSALLLAACTGDADNDAEASPSPTVTAASPTETESGAVYDVVGACSAFFYGEGSLSAFVQEAAPSIAAPVDDTTVGTVTGASQRLAAILPLVEDESATYIEAIKAPFDAALEGTVGDPATVTTAIEEYSAACETAGYEG